MNRSYMYNKLIHTKTKLMVHYTITESLLFVKQFVKYPFTLLSYILIHKHYKFITTN